MDELVDGDLVTSGIALPGDAELASASAANLSMGSSLDWKNLSKVYKLNDCFGYAQATPHSVEPLVCSAVATKFLS